jgi:putative ABC transport system ATP-binding protein
MSGLLELERIAKSYALPSGERLEILNGLDLTIARGEVVAIVGRSGSGKSTLLNLLGLLDQPTSGSFRCDGVETEKLNDSRRSRLRGEFFGFIFQQFHLLDRRTALENVAEPLLFAKRTELRQRHQRAAALLEQVGLAERMHSMPHLLSGGEQQRVAIARALVRRPPVVLADEPTGALDEATGERVLNLLLDLVRSENVSMILVTHERAVAERADRVLTLTGGKLEARAE